MLVYVNKFNPEDEYKKSIINKNLTGLKDSGFVRKRKDGHKTFWAINQKNKFLSNLIKLMKSPKNDNIGFDVEHGAVIFFFDAIRFFEKGEQ